MDIGWNFRREHLPPRAAIALRHHRRRRPAERRPAHRVGLVLLPRRPTIRSIKELWATGDTIAKAAAMMTGTELLPTRVLGCAWPQHFNQRRRRGHLRQHPEGRAAGVERRRSDARARRCRRSSGSASQGLPHASPQHAAGPASTDNTGGGSDDIGDVSWNVPTITLRYPSNIPGLPGHNWANAIAMATPIAHKGVDRRRQGAGDDDDRSADASRSSSQRRGTTSGTCRRKDTKYEPLLRAAGQAGDRAEQEHHGQATGRR